MAEHTQTLPVTSVIHSLLHNLTLFFIYTGRFGWSVMYMVSEKQSAPPRGCTRAGASAPAPRAPAALGTQHPHTWEAFDFLLWVSEQAGYRAPVISKTWPNIQWHSLFYSGNRWVCRARSAAASRLNTANLLSKQCIPPGAAPYLHINIWSFMSNLQICNE